MSRPYRDRSPKHSPCCIPTGNESCDACPRYPAVHRRVDCNQPPDFYQLCCLLPRVQTPRESQKVRQRPAAGPLLRCDCASNAPQSPRSTRVQQKSAAKCSNDALSCRASRCHYTPPDQEETPATHRCLPRRHIRPHGALPHIWPNRRHIHPCPKPAGPCTALDTKSPACPLDSPQEHAHSSDTGQAHAVRWSPAGSHHLLPPPRRQKMPRDPLSLISPAQRPKTSRTKKYQGAEESDDAYDHT